MSQHRAFESRRCMRVLPEKPRTRPWCNMTLLANLYCVQHGHATTLDSQLGSFITMFFNWSFVAEGNQQQHAIRFLSFIFVCSFLIVCVGFLF